MSFLTQLLGMGIRIEAKIDHPNGEPYTTVSRKSRWGQGFELQHPNAFNTKMTPEVWNRCRNEEKQAAEKAAENKKIEAEKIAKRNASSEKNIKNSNQHTTQNKTEKVRHSSFKSKN